MNFVQVRSFDNYISAHIQMEMLRSEGINCHLADEYTITIDPLLSPAIGGMKLMVDTLEAEHARELLDRIDNNHLRAI